jgi:hypothetical protein
MNSSLIRKLEIRGCLNPVSYPVYACKHNNSNNNNNNNNNNCDKVFFSILF